MPAILNTCPHCSKERVSDGDWPSCVACAPILADYPDLEKIENDQARSVVMKAFQQVQKLRCDFLQGLVWVGAGPQVKDSPRIDSEGLLVLPSWMSLRPAAMIQAEDDLITKANRKDCPLIDIEMQADAYVWRFDVFLLNQRTQALNL